MNPIQGNLFSEPTADELMKLIRVLVSDKHLEASDLALTDFFYRKFGSQSSPLIAAVLWLSIALKQGHTSLNLNDIHQNPELLSSSENMNTLLKQLPVFKNWAERLASFEAVGSISSTKNEPLVLENDQLYFRRFFAYESELASTLHKRAQQPFKLQADSAMVKRRLNEWFDAGKGSLWQKLACLNALGRSFTVITGGPGTGKTHTVLRLMALMLEADFEGKESIALAAPTGKAAARVGESILNGLSGLNLPESITKRLPVKAQTIHRLLGYRFQSNIFNYNRDNPLPYSVIIIDEASMIDLTLMTKLLEAVKEDAKLILLGDKDQLSSVEAGSVFADICASSDLNRFSASFCSLANEYGIEIGREDVHENVHPLQECIIQLMESRRFGSESGIGKLAQAINLGRADEALHLLKSSEHQQEISLIQHTQENLNALITANSKEQYQCYVDSSVSETEKLAAMTRFQFLCAHKKGDFSVESVNLKAEAILTVKASRSKWYHGRPVIMLENDYQINVFNGDTALCMMTDEGNYDVIFESFDEKTAQKIIRRIPVVRLSHPETSWALSVHKSQGSEYDTVAVVLPSKISPVVTRELLYTGITRAKKKVILIGSESIIRKAIEQKTKRFGGLRNKLWSTK